MSDGTRGRSLYRGPVSPFTHDYPTVPAPRPPDPSGHDKLTRRDGLVLRGLVPVPLYRLYVHSCCFTCYDTPLL